MTKKAMAFDGWYKAWKEGRSKSASPSMRSLQSLESDLNNYTNNRENLCKGMVKAQEIGDLKLFNYHLEHWTIYDNRIKAIKKQVTALKKLAKETPPPVAEDASDVYKSLLKHTKIDNVVVEGSKLVIGTSMIVNNYVEFGHYTISLLSGASAESARFHNLDWVYGENGHPHTNTSGRGCFGSYLEAILRFERQGELLFMIEALIVFLELADGLHNPFVDRGQWIEYRRPIRRESVSKVQESPSKFIIDNSVPMSVGDMVMAKNDNGYFLTRDGWIGKIIAIDVDGSRMIVIGPSFEQGESVYCNKFDRIVPAPTRRGRPRRKTVEGVAGKDLTLGDVVRRQRERYSAFIISSGESA